MTTCLLLINLSLNNHLFLIKVLLVKTGKSPLVRVQNLLFSGWIQKFFISNWIPFATHNSFLFISKATSWALYLKAFFPYLEEDKTPSWDVLLLLNSISCFSKYL